MSYKDWIEKMRREWTGRTVIYQGEPHTVVDVDYNGALLLDIPTRFTDTTAVAEWMLD